MTVDEVRSCINAGGVIECENVFQRGEAVQFLIDIGYEIHPVAKDWLERNPDNPQFLHPGLDDGKPKLTCWRWTEGKQTIPFRDIEDLIAKNDSLFDERSDAEFAEDFALLIEPQGCEYVEDM